MRKIVALVAMLAMMLAAAAPAFAQDAIADDGATAIGGDVDNSVTAEFFFAPQVQVAANLQFGSAVAGTGDAVATDGSLVLVDNSSSLDTTLWVDQSQWNGGF